MMMHFFIAAWNMENNYDNLFYIIVKITLKKCQSLQVCNFFSNKSNVILNNDI